MSQCPNLFPLVLDMLSNKPFFSVTQTNLLEDVVAKLKSEGVEVQNLHKELQATIDQAKGLGILLVENEDVRMPFLLKGAKPAEWTRLTDDLESGVASRSHSTPGKSNSKEVAPTTQKNITKPEKPKNRIRSRNRRKSHISRKSKRTRRARKWK